MSETDRTARYELRRARLRLSQFVVHSARRKRDCLGIGWAGTPTAPSTYSDLTATYQACLRSGAPLPVSNLNSDSIIYMATPINLAFRFWHDCAHAETGLGFSHEDEFELAHRQLAELERSGFSCNSLEYALFHADTLGQIVLNAVAGRFPLDQKRFGIDCALHGLDNGIRTELRRAS